MNNFENYISNNHHIVEIMVPLNLASRVVPYILSIIPHYSGEIMSFSHGENDSLHIKLIMDDDEQRQEFYDMLKNIFESSNSFVATPIKSDDGQRLLDYRFSIQFLFTEFLSIMQQIEPLIDFIYENTELSGQELNIPSGLQVLVEKLSAGALPADLIQSLNTFGLFMGSYLVGFRMVDEAIMYPNIKIDIDEEEL